MKRRPTGINQAPFDKYTSAHAGFGVVYAYFGVPLWAAVAISIAFEAFENRLKDRYPRAFPYSSHDSLANSVGDTLAVAVGHMVAHHAMQHGLSPGEKQALEATVAATLGGFVGAIAMGGAADRIDEKASAAGELGYRVGGAFGAAVGSHRAGATALPAGATAAGGYFGGPIGAGMAALAVGQSG